MNWKRWTAALVVLGAGAAMFLSAHRARGFHGHFWRTLGAFVEAFGGLLGILLIGLCVLAFFFVADALWPKDEENDPSS